MNEETIEYRLDQIEKHRDRIAQTDNRTGNQNCEC